MNYYMSFQYEEYYECLFTVPLFILLIVVFFMAGRLKSVILQLKQIQSCKHGGFKHLVEPLLYFFIIATFFYVFLNQLYYGVAVKKDSNATPLSTIGQIEEIEDGPIGVRFHYNGHQERGNILTVSGEKYFFITCGDLSVGDSIEMVYLPNSKAVLRCTKIQPD